MSEQSSGQGTHLSQSVCAQAIYAVDFNSVDPRSWDVRGLRNRVLFRCSAPTLHERVLLRDTEGNGCEAWITKLGDRILRFRLDPGTWQEGGTR